MNSGLQKSARTLVKVVMATISAPGCSSCEKGSQRDTNTTASSFEIAPGRLEPPWVWKDGEAQPFAVPSGCRLVAKPKRHDRDTTNLFFLAVPNDPTSLAVATGALDPDAVTSTRGILSLGTKDEGKTRDIPWLHLAVPPVMAASSRGWIALLPEQDAFGPMVRIWLWREGGKLDVLSEGDGLTVVDAQCDDGGCVVLTTLAGNVATRGATLWMGDPQRASKTMSRVDVSADKVAEGAVPVRIMGWNGRKNVATLLFDAPKHVYLYDIDSGRVRPIGRLERGSTVIDAVVTKSERVVIMTRGEPDAEGCVGAGAKVEIATLAGGSELISNAVLPDSGYARQLGTGAFVTWVAPTNCRAPDRKVVHGVLVDEHGKPAASAMAIGDATGHAVTTRGDEVHLWLRDSKGVTWLTAKCAATNR